MPFDSVGCCHPLDFAQEVSLLVQCVNVNFWKLHPWGSMFFMSQEIENSDFGLDLVIGGTLSFVEDCPLKSRRLYAIWFSWVLSPTEFSFKEVSLLVKCVNVNLWMLHPWGSTFFMSQEIENSDFGIDLVMGGTLSFVEGCPLKSRRLYAIWLSWVLSPTAVSLKRSHHLSSV